MRNTFFLLLFLISGVCFSQNPDPFWDGIRTKLVQPDTLSTFDRDALTPKLGTILYHKDTGISQWEQWDGAEWKTFGEGIPRDSLIVQSPSSLGNIYHYWKGTEAQQDSILGLDPNFFDDMLWICTDCPQQGGGGTADQFVMGDSSFKDFIDDDTFASATSTNIPSAESVKAYVDANVVTIESGTWTPTIPGCTLTVSYAEYIKIGNKVTIFCKVGAVSGTTLDILGVHNIPFPIEPNGIFGVSISAFYGFGTSFYSVYGRRGDPYTIEFLIQNNFDSGNNTVIPAGISPTNGNIELVATYITNE